MRLKRFIKWTLLGLATLVLLAGIAAFTMDLGFLRPLVEKRVSLATGRDFSIDGDLSIRLGRTLVVQAGDLRMANAQWAAEPGFLGIGRVRAVVAARSLLNGPVIVERLEVAGLDLALEQDASGLGNWQFGDPATADPGGEWPLVLRTLLLENAGLRFATPRLDQPLVATIDRLEQALEPDGQLGLGMTGTLSDRPVRVDASLGPAAQLRAGRDVTLNGSGSFGSIELSGQATFDDLRAPRRPVIDLRLEGADFQELTAMLGIDGLGTGDLSLRVTTALAGDGMSGRAQGRLGRLEIDATGTFPSLQEIGRAAVTARISGPNFGRLARLAGMAGWPEEPFRIQAALQRPDNALLIEDFDLRLGDNTVTLKGALPAYPALAGSDLELRVSGPDLTPFGAALGMEDLPGGAFSISGDVATDDAGRTSIDLEYRVPAVGGRISGTLGSGPGLAGSELVISGSGANAGEAGRLLGIGGLVPEPWSLDLEVAAGPDFYDVAALKFTAASLEAQARGRVSAESASRASDLHFSVRGARLADLQALAGDGVTLPPQPFDIGGRATATGGRWDLEKVQGTAGATRIEVNGRLGAGPGFAGTDLAVRADGTGLDRLLTLPGPARLPGGDYAVTAKVQLDQGRLRVARLDLGAGEFQLELADVDVPWPLDLGQAGRFGVQARGTDITRVLPELAGLALDPAGFELEARGLWNGNSISLDKGAARIGDSRLNVTGILDRPPDLSATRLSLALQSPDLSRLGTLDGERLGKGPLELRAEVTGTANRVLAEDLRARVGDNSLRGAFAMDFGPSLRVPAIDLRLSTPTLDLKPFQAETNASGGAGGNAAAGRRLVPELEFPMDLLARYDGRFDIAADRVLLRKMTLGKASLKGTVSDGRLQVEEFGADGYKGRLAASLTLEPAAGGRPRLAATVRSTGLVLDLASQAAADKPNLPAFDVEIGLRGSGPTLRDVAATLNGDIRVNSEGGQVRNVAGDAVGRKPLLAQVVTAVSPEASRRDVINVSCVAAVLKARDGTLALDPGVAIQSDKLNLFARGKVTLADEKIDVSVRTQTRKAVDISASEVFSPYVKLAGTLAAPSVAIDPKGTLLSGGAAYLSGGLSILAKKALDQLGGTQDPCSGVLAEAQRDPPRDGG